MARWAPFVCRAFACSSGLPDLLFSFGEPLGAACPRCRRGRPPLEAPGSVTCRPFGRLGGAAPTAAPLDGFGRGLLRRPRLPRAVVDDENELPDLHLVAGLDPQLLDRAGDR